MKERIDHLLLVNQRQIMSQSLQYSLKILEMNNLELREYVDEKFMDNPFLMEKSNHENRHINVEKLQSKNNLRNEIFKETSFLHFNDSEKKIAEMLVD
ncbi:MAG: hypothetical protein LBO02_03205, partial [Holosporaceae bacterium]|nr:hypothetical protein [Holosporaceae bacterium]